MCSSNPRWLYTTLMAPSFGANVTQCFARRCSVVVSTQDSDSCNASSNLASGFFLLQPTTALAPCATRFCAPQTRCSPYTELLSMAHTHATPQWSVCMYCSEFESRQWLLFAPAHNCFGTLCNSLLCPSDTLQSLYRAAEHGTHACDTTVECLHVLQRVRISPVASFCSSPQLLWHPVQLASVPLRHAAVPIPSC